MFFFVFLKVTQPQFTDEMSNLKAADGRMHYRNWRQQPQQVFRMKNGRPTILVDAGVEI